MRTGMRTQVRTRREFLKDGCLVGVAAALGAGSGALAEGEAKPLAQFDYGDVSLASGRCEGQFAQTQSVLMGLNEDALLRPWRVRAGLPAPGPQLGGWYDEGGFAPGHAFGQWISALSRGYAADRDPAKRERVARLLDLYEPVISARFYQDFRFPSYDYDKMVIGLIDAHRFAGIEKAFSLLDRTTDAAGPNLPPKALERGAEQREWRASVKDKTSDDYTWDEPYTLPENLYLAADRGAGERYRRMAGRYLLDATWFDPLAAGQNVLAGRHAYSFCNSLSSAMQAYLSAGSEKHLLAAKNGFQMIAAQSYATGGWGPNEAFVEPGTGALKASLTKTHSSFETPCGSYAQSKLSRYLLRVTRDGMYGDSMERVIYNTVLGAKPLEPDGRAFYYSDYSNQGSKFYFKDAWPCCAGTLPQVAADYRIMTYLRGEDGVYVNLYLPSTLRWTNGDGAEIALTQTGEYPLEGRVRLTVESARASEFALWLRIPRWAQNGATIRVNGKAVNALTVRGFARVARRWQSGDSVELDLPLTMRLEVIEPESRGTRAVMRGPLVLFALGEDASPVTGAQLLAATREGSSAVWRAEATAGSVLLTPFTEIGDGHYRTYLDLAKKA